MAKLKEIIDAIPAKQVVGIVLALATALVSMMQSRGAQESAEEAWAEVDSVSAEVAEAVSYAEFVASTDSLKRRIAGLERQVRTLRKAEAKAGRPVRSYRRPPPKPKQSFWSRLFG